MAGGAGIEPASILVNSQPHTPCLLSPNSLNLAADLRIELRLSVSKTALLPLEESAIFGVAFSERLPRLIRQGLAAP